MEQIREERKMYYILPLVDLSFTSVKGSCCEMNVFIEDMIERREVLFGRGRGQLINARHGDFRCHKCVETRVRDC
jgi:hypothetical protein